MATLRGTTLFLSIAAAPRGASAWGELWGEVAPDTTGCWLEDGFTFEFCCLAWTHHSIGVGTGECWIAGFTYERCCVPTLRARDIFHCRDGDPAWNKLRRESQLSRNAAGWGLKQALSLPSMSCIMGSFHASLLDLFLRASIETPGVEVNWKLSFAQADAKFRVLLASPISLDEMLQSGWPFPKAFMSLFFTDKVAKHAAFLVAEEKVQMYQPSHSVIELYQEIRSAAVTGKRVPQDYILQVLAGFDRKIPPELAALIAMCNAHTIRSIEAPRAPRQQRQAMADEAARLLRFAGQNLKTALLVKGASGGDGPGPLAVLLSMAVPLIPVLLAMQQDAIATVKPLGLLGSEGLAFEPPAGLHPSVWLSEGEDGLPDVARVEMHVLPIDDSVSNLVRSSKLPFCHGRTTSYLRLVLAMGRIAEACKRGVVKGRCSPAWEAGAKTARTQKLRLWEIGANLGDCTLSAAAFLSGRPKGQKLPGVKLDMEAFEPIVDSAQAMQRSAQAFEAQIRERDGDSFMNPKITAHALGLSDHAGTVEVGIPLHSAAETTAHNCNRQYGEYHGCTFTEIKTTTMDEAIGLKRASKACKAHTFNCNIDPLDLVKVHVQGHEMQVLRGAKLTLRSGLLCVLILRVFYRDAFITKKNLAKEFVSMLQNYTALLVDSHGNGIKLDSSGHALQEWLDEVSVCDGTMEGCHKSYNDVVAWHDGGVCQDRLSVQAAKALLDDDSGKALFASMQHDVDSVS